MDVALLLAAISAASSADYFLIQANQRLKSKKASKKAADKISRASVELRVAVNEIKVRLNNPSSKPSDFAAALKKLDQCGKKLEGLTESGIRSRHAFANLQEGEGFPQPPQVSPRGEEERERLEKALELELKGLDKRAQETTLLAKRVASHRRRVEGN